MKNQFKYLSIGQLFSTSNPLGFQVLSGEVWVTIEGDETDYVLKRGENLRSPGNRMMVIEALTDASFTYVQSEEKIEIGA